MAMVQKRFHRAVPGGLVVIVGVMAQLTENTPAIPICLVRMAEAERDAVEMGAQAEPDLSVVPVVYLVVLIAIVLHRASQVRQEVQVQLVPMVVQVRPVL